MEIAKTKTIVLSQAERFCEGLKMLSIECGLSTIEYNKVGSLKFHFDDGSSVAGLRACIEAGLINGFSC